MKYIKRKFQTPFRPWDRQRIDNEREILSSFGLRNKKELWRAQAELRKFRRLARDFVAVKDPSHEKVILEKLVKLGILGESDGIDNILALTVDDFLKRRLQTVLKEKGLANTIKHSRQMIVHGHVKIGGRKVVYPSFMVSREDEDRIVVDGAKETVVVKAEPETKAEGAE